MITYKISPGMVKSFCSIEKPFLAFNEFVDIVQAERDHYYAPNNVTGFKEDIGKRYNVWTRHTVSHYHRHLFPVELTDDVSVSFSIPHLDKNASFPINVSIYDDLGVYFEHEQEVVLERFVNDRFVLTSWRKVPEIRDFLLSQVES